jgi:hypothetical protein
MAMSEPTTRSRPSGRYESPRTRRGHRSGCDVHCDPAHAALAQFDLAGVRPGPDLQADAGQLLPNGGCAADRPAWAIEGGQDAVASGLDESALEFLDHAAGELVVHSQDLAPAPIAKLSGPIGGADDVGE